MEKSFYTGKGIGVCILDTGIYEHIDFTGRIWAFMISWLLKGGLMTIMDMAPMQPGWWQEMALLPWENTEAQHLAAESLP